MLLHKIHDAKILWYSIVTWHRKILSVVRYWQIYLISVSSRSLLESRAFWRIIPTWQSRQERRRLKYVGSTWCRSTVCDSKARWRVRDVRKPPCRRSCKPRNVRKSARPRALTSIVRELYIFSDRADAWFAKGVDRWKTISSFRIANFDTILIDKFIVWYMDKTSACY